MVDHEKMSFVFVCHFLHMFHELWHLSFDLGAEDILGVVNDSVFSFLFHQ